MGDHPHRCALSGVVCGRERAFVSVRETWDVSRDVALSLTAAEGGVELMYEGSIMKEAEAMLHFGSGWVPKVIPMQMVEGIF